MAIQWEMQGYSKTIVADTASSALAIGYAARAIQEGRASTMLAGGAESPITPYTYSFCARSGRLSSTGYRIFDSESSGFLVGEGAVILVLEELRAAQQRNAHIYAELAGWATGYLPHTNTPWSDEGQRFSRLIKQALDNASMTPDQIDYVGLDAQGLLAADITEAQALVHTFGLSQPRLVATTCKPTLTHLLGAGAAAEVATALLALQHGVIPPVAECLSLDKACPLDLVVGKPRQMVARTALVNARGADGVQTALVFKRV